eukprot:12923245-Prorocentrum_lima.AAC.1
MKVQYLIEKEDIHQTRPFPKPRVRHRISGPLKAKVVQSVEEQKEHIMTALVNLVKKRVVPYARTKFPDENP